MEVRRPFSDPERRGNEVDFTKGNRDAIARSAEKAAEVEAAARARRQEESARAESKDEPDKLDLAAAEREAVEERKRSERVAELKALHTRGVLNTPERIERAAGRMLAGE